VAEPTGDPSRESAGDLASLQDQESGFTGCGIGPPLEAILLVIDEPVPAADLAGVLGVPLGVVEATLERLRADYDQSGRGFELANRGGGWRLYTRGDYADVVERFVLDGQQARLTHASLETLAIIAYRQPVSRARIAAIRGVNSDAVVRTLLNRGMVTEVGMDPDSGAVLFGTTSYFLEKMGIASLSELPDLAPLLPDIEALLDEDSRLG
jgi:segregation and condensation protein B